MKTGQSSEHFYRDLPPLSEFGVSGDLRGFHAVPADWLIVIADVKDSTKSVKAGQYKQVNMVGASCITAVLNVLGDKDIPFVFGGDGATLLIPGHVKHKVESALTEVRSLAQREFDIQLRIGFVAVSIVRESGVDVLVAKFRVSEANSLAMFSGGGIELADRLIKADNDCIEYAIPQATISTMPDLSGLSCRWQPLKSVKGRMICLLIQAVEKDTASRHQILKDILAHINTILDNDITRSNPVADNTLKFGWPPDGLKMEAILTRGQQPFFRRYLFLLFQSFVQAVLERFKLTAGHYNAVAYKKELQTNSDYRRYDDALRLVLDCSETQINRITDLLEQQHQLGNIVYGIHKTDQAQMTCLIFSLEHHEHIHFIDGSDGGFWAAAEQYKQQLKKTIESY